MADVKVKASQEEIDEALSLLRRTKEQRAKQRDRVKNDPSLKAKQKERQLTQRARRNIIEKKAMASGITATPAEIAAEVKRLQSTAKAG